MKTGKGLTFVEIIVAIFVFAVLAIPVFTTMTSSRTESLKAVNYLRALELAQETIEWILATPVKAGFDEKITKLSGSIVKDEGGKFSPVSMAIGSNDLYPTDARELLYPEQYVNAFFYRKVEVSPLEDGPTKGLLKKVTVTVWWCEGKKPSTIETSDKNDSARNKKLSLSILVVDNTGVF